MAFNVFWRTTALGLNRRENYRLERDHRRGLVYKLFIFQFKNACVRSPSSTSRSSSRMASRHDHRAQRRVPPSTPPTPPRPRTRSSADVDGSTLDDGSAYIRGRGANVRRGVRLLLISLMRGPTSSGGPLLELKRVAADVSLTKVKAKGKRLFAMSKGKRAVHRSRSSTAEGAKGGELRRGARAHRAIESASAAEVGGRLGRRQPRGRRGARDVVRRADRAV